MTTNHHNEQGLCCDTCHTVASENDTMCWNCNGTTFVYEPSNMKPPIRYHQDERDEKKLRWLIENVSDPHHGCEYRQNGEPRTSVKCAGCLHSRQSYEKTVENVEKFFQVYADKKVREVLDRADKSVNGALYIGLGREQTISQLQKGK